ncbi:reverse transcriptase [Fusarium beomiforme]|uniref:Reverse transcriptase n=1 Tax=Fusarium beomiforme TaxID=44412 RepID=A0A9P5ADD3_9HYPO|nr:reverse transcriptase [Fusarium beomiforme]
MVDAIGAEIVVEQDDAPFSTPKRPSRMVRPTSKVRDTARQLEDTAIETRRNTRLAMRNVPAEEQIDRPTETRKSSGSGSGSSDGRAMLQKALDLLAESRRETKRLQEALKERSYADVTQLTPFLPHNDSRTLAAPPNPTDVLYCTIDVSRLGEDETRLSAGTIRATVENEIRSELDNPTWRCRAVTKDPKNPHRIRITCRDESEHEIVKRIAETKLAPGARILRDDLYPIRVDNVSRIAVLDERNEVRAEITEMLGRENDTKVVKIVWLSKRDIPKAYGSMVVYLKKRSEARRFISEGATIASRSRTTKPTSATDRKFAASVREKVITIADAQKRS